MVYIVRIRHMTEIKVITQVGVSIVENHVLVRVFFYLLSFIVPMSTLDLYP